MRQMSLVVMEPKGFEPSTFTGHTVILLPLSYGPVTAKDTVRAE